MKDWYEERKKAAREQEMRDAENSKMALIMEIKSGLGEKMVEELEKIKAPTKRKLIWCNFKKILGL